MFYRVDQGTLLKWQFSFVKILGSQSIEEIVTGIRIRDRPIISPIKPKFDDQFFVDLLTWLVHVVNLKLFCKSKQKLFHVRDL